MLERIVEIAQTKTAALGYAWDPRLELILRYCVQSPGFSAFPGNFTTETAEKYLAAYIRRYFDGRSARLTLKEVGTTPDPAVDVILRSFVGLRDLATVSQHHRKAMAAENLLGELLERYLAQQLEGNGWIWCAGSTVRAVDFLKTDLSVALQVKNRDNSENSSSSAIRAGTTIQKWFRVFSKTGLTNWEHFPAELPEPLSEDGFYAFIEQYARAG